MSRHAVSDVPPLSTAAGIVAVAAAMVLLMGSSFQSLGYEKEYRNYVAALELIGSSLRAPPDSASGQEGPLCRS